MCKRTEGKGKSRAFEANRGSYKQAKIQNTGKKKDFMKNSLKGH